jgi:hypothetical protein
MARTAILGAGFETHANVREFPPGWSPALARFAPESLAGPAQTLCWLARALASKRVSLPPLRAILIAFTGETYGELGAAGRSLLSETFRVPVFEQMRNASGELLAAECAAHTGLHLVNSLQSLGSALLEFDSIDQGPCPCGSLLPRLVTAESVKSGNDGHKAAAAG